ncbi:MAG TPA: hypothetical protein PK011_07545, partial [Marinagarivorans sp.]|nr:hypothetical protein [Marinagarivorans sp.]
GAALKQENPRIFVGLAQRMQNAGYIFQRFLNNLLKLPQINQNSPSPVVFCRLSRQKPCPSEMKKLLWGVHPMINRLRFMVNCHT